MLSRPSKFFVSIITAALLICGAVGFSGAEEPPISVLDLNQQISDKKEQIASIRNQIKLYQQSISLREKEAVTLENETAILEDTIAKVSLDIQASEEEIFQLDLETKQVALEISNKESEISSLRDKLSGILRELYANGDKDYLEVFLVNNTISDFFDTVHYLELTQTHLKDSLERMKLLRDELQVQQAVLQQSADKQLQLRNQLIQQKLQIDELRQAKQQRIVQSLLSKDKFQQLLNEARREQEEITSDISQLQEAVREKLHLISGGDVQFAWPVDPSRGISAYFHDRSYPFRDIFEHSAIDIRAYQGSYVRAAEDGYVGRAKDAGKGYSYIMILHDKGFASVYGHISHIMVKEESFVKKGQVIGLSGGTPGSNGAGSFTTGPHLHFEVRVNGVPDDPLKYLP